MTPKYYIYLSWSDLQTQSSFGVSHVPDKSMNGVLTGFLIQGNRYGLAIPEKIQYLRVFMTTAATLEVLFSIVSVHIIPFKKFIVILFE